MLLNIKNKGKIINAPYIVNQEFLKELAIGEDICDGYCTKFDVVDSGDQIICMILADNNDKYLIMHEMIHLLQSVNVPVINQALDLYFNEMCEEYPMAHKNYVDWATENLTAYYEEWFDVNPDIYIKNEIMAHMISDAYMESGENPDDFFNLIEDLTGYKVNVYEDNIYEIE